MTLYADLFRYGDLFLNLFRRELSVKYRGSVLGLGWTLVLPIVLMGVYTVVFSVLLKAVDIHHYPLFLLSGLVTWVFFQGAIQSSCTSLLGQASPREAGALSPATAPVRSRRDERGHAARHARGASSR